MISRDADQARSEPVDVLGLRVPVVMALFRHSITTIGQLIIRTKEELLKIPVINQWDIQMIETGLRGLGLELKSN